MKNAFRVRLDWQVGEEHLPLLYIQNIIRNRGKTLKEFYDRLGINFDLCIQHGTGSPESLRALVHNECELALSGAITFAEHFEKENQNVMSVGLLIQKSPIAILSDKNKMNVPTGTVTGKKLRASLNKQRIGVFPNSTVRDWIRYLAQEHQLKPNSIVEIPDAREFGTNMLHNVPCLICYEYNQAIEVLCRSGASDRFIEILLRDDVTNIGLRNLVLVRLLSENDKVKYTKMPGVAFVASCTRWYADKRDTKVFKARLKKLLEAITMVLKEIKKKNRAELKRLVEKISKESRGLYIPAPSRVLYRKLKLLRETYWSTSVCDGNSEDRWEEVYTFCGFPVENVREGTKDQTGLFYNP